ncbi:putative formamidopyrimidine-DNA glycosylase-like protein [Thalassoglobus neptunius]|uniref:Putative formamidopyrimidine-DNA glycosylase-like protein n=1 Tax=Thalassoglobus neptunius TaxID=1938619 RepID=A0A5C5X2A5_9PLAN|nr:DNA-formamidopyrimidine glycosylase family protein [Thalassoglobus neptunius]TWT56960.1 putative formamidopyrimidine-DNA glycosylase-like protein [Thalassoglobus neptunius]
MGCQHPLSFWSDWLQSMPELPDISIYLEALQSRIVGANLVRARIISPFLLRTFDPPVDAVLEHRVTELRRLGKRVAIGFDNDVWYVFHLMIAGRFQWKAEGDQFSKRYGLAQLEFTTGTLILTEAGSKNRASLHVVTSADLEDLDPGGIDVLTATLEEFQQSLQLTNRTLKRQLTSPMLFSGIGNAYSDEILHRAGLSPIQHTQKLTPEEVERLYSATQEVMTEWTSRLRKKAKGGFPKKVTAFHREMAVHGKFGEPCPVCGSPVQRIVYADNETNYCATCQTKGKVLADRSLSRLLKSDWPRRIEDWEEGSS